MHFGFICFNNNNAREEENGANNSAKKVKQQRIYKNCIFIGRFKTVALY